MAEKVTFEGDMKHIHCEPGVTSLNILEDVYSAWKRWIALSDNSKYPQAFSVIGGEPTIGALRTGTTFFLMNGWKIKPQEANHTLIIDGNLFTTDGSDPITATEGTYNVLVRINNSNLVDTVATGSGVTQQDKVDIATLVSESGIGISANDKDEIATKSRNKLLPFVV
jgi:hypothetical protein